MLTCLLAVHSCVDLAVAKKELPLIFNGDKSITPASGVGSNVDRPEQERAVPRAVLCGAGIPREEFEDLQKHVHAELGHDITWFKIYPEDMGRAGSAMPPLSDMVPDPVKIVKVFKEKMAAAGFK